MHFKDLLLKGTSCQWDCSLESYSKTSPSNTGRYFLSVCVLGIFICEIRHHLSYTAVFMCGFVGWLGRWLNEERYMREREWVSEWVRVSLCGWYWFQIIGVLRVYWVTKFWNHHLTGSTVVSILLVVLCWCYFYRAWILTFGEVISLTFW